MASQPTGRAEVTLHPRPSPTAAAATTSTTNSSNNNPLPQLLHTPTGLALLELQGTINLPQPPSDDDDDDRPAAVATTNIGRVDFPDYRPDAVTFDASSTAWMRRAYLYVGPHQRLTGEVRKLPRAMAVVRRRAGAGAGGEGGGEAAGEEGDLEVVDIVRYKIVFSSRPEPVGTD